MDVTIYPEEGNFPRIAKALLEVADDPRQVQMVSHPQAGFRVPEDVFERFQATYSPDGSQAQEPKAPKRKPGRPRKVAEPEATQEPTTATQVNEDSATGDTGKEEE